MENILFAASSLCIHIFPYIEKLATLTNFMIPQFSITRQSPSPKYVLVLENSQTMNMQDNWDYICMASKKFIVHDLPDLALVGLVLFNEAAHIAYPISQLGPKTSPQKVLRSASRTSTTCRQAQTVVSAAAWSRPLPLPSSLSNTRVPTGDDAQVGPEN